MIAHWLFVAFVAAQALDVSSTAVKLHQGCKEQVWPGGAAVIAGGKSAGVLLTWKLGQHHKALGVGLSVAGIGSGLYGGIHNLKQSCTR